MGGSDIFTLRRCDFRVVVICTYALAGARGVSVCHRAFVRALVLSICGSLSRTLWSRFVESCRDLMFS